MDTSVRKFEKGYTWDKLCNSVIGAKKIHSNLLAARLGWERSDERTAPLLARLKLTMEWLGMNEHTVVDPNATTYLDALCSLLQDKLVYKKGERDMVAMHHEFKIEWQNGEKVYSI